MSSYHRLLVWQKGMTLAETVYKSTASFPSSELFGLQSQLRRSAVSVPSNIAEGYGRSGNSELRRFLTISRGSLFELGTQIEIAARVGLFTDEESTPIFLLITELEKMLNAYIKRLL